MEMRRKPPSSHSATIVYLDDVISTNVEGDQLTLADMLYADDSSFEAIDTQDVLTAYISHADNLDRDVVKLLLAGKTQVEIGLALGHSQSYISRVVIRNQKRLRAMLFDEGGGDGGRHANRRSLSCTASRVS